MRLLTSEISLLKKERAKWWCCTPLIPALGRQRQADLCEFKANLVYRVSFRKSGLCREILSQNKIKRDREKMSKAVAQK